MPTQALFFADETRFTKDWILRGCAPIGHCEGLAAFQAAFIAPFAAAFPQATLRTDVLLEGEFKGHRWRARSGHLHGRFVAPLFGIPATGRVAHIRFGIFDRLSGDEIAETLLLFDLPSLMIQAGIWPLSPSMGPSIMAPAPLGGGVTNAAASAEESTQSLALVEGMIGGLMQFDGRLKSMNMCDFWHDDFWWFGPDPIGSFQGHTDYERGHQLPFLTAFPDRVGGNHRARIAQGSFIASTGWPSITATHQGGGWLGLAPTGRAVTMRVMDFWRRDGERLAENWVMIDLIDLLKQMGVDVFARLAARNDRS